MAVTFPYVRAAVWSDGSTTDTAAKRNTIEDGIFNAHQAPAVRVYHNATQSLTNATETALAFNTERWDVAGGASAAQHDTVTNNSRLTCLYAGKYAVTGHVEFAANATGSRYIFVRINGTASQLIGLIQTHATLTGGQVVDLTLYTHVDLAVNDYIQLFAFQNSGGALNVSASSALGQYQCEFMMVRVA